jgi:DNA-binding Xre family transcriptional regulator
MIRLRINEVAKQRGVSISKLQLDCRMSLSTLRRYFHSSRTGMRKHAGTLREVNLATLATIASALKVEPGELLARVEEGEES